MTSPYPQKPQFDALCAARRAGLRLLALVFLFSIFVNLLMLTGPLFMLQVYDRVLASRSEETLLALFMLVGFFYVLMAMLDFARGRISARCGARFQAVLDPLVFDCTLSAAQSPANGRQDNLNDLEVIQTVFAAPAFLALFDVIWTPFFLALIFLFHPALGWVALAGGTVLIGITALNQWLTAQKTAHAHAVSCSANRFTEESLCAREVVLTQAMTPAIKTRWLHARGRALTLRLSAADVSGSLASLSKALRLFLQSSMLAIGAYYVLQEDLTAGIMIAASILLGRALSPLDQILTQWPLFQQALRSWRSLSASLSDRPTEPVRITLPRPQAALRFESVSLMGDDGATPVLQDISFELRPGQALGVIGRSGSGKTCLAKTAVGYWQARRGQIYLGGAKLHQYPSDQLGKLIGYLPQQVRFFSGTIAENIARMAPDPDATAAITAARRANAHDMILTLPDGYNTRIRADRVTLSGGQRQRIALARALFCDPIILILDEPNAALDADGSAALNRTIQEVKAQGNSVLVLTHRPTAIAECNALIILDHGRVTASGPRNEVLRTQIRNAEECVARVQGA